MNKIKIVSLLWGYRSGGVTQCVKNYARLPQTNSIGIKTVILQPETWSEDFSGLKGTDYKVIRFKRKYSFSWLKGLVSFMKQESPDILFAHAFNGTIISLLLRILYRKKFIIVCSYHGVYIPPSPGKKIFGKIYNNLSLFINNRLAKGVVCVSDFSKNELISYGIPEEKIHVVYNGIHPEPLVRSVPRFPLISFGDEKKVIGTVCRLVPLKGLETLIDSIIEIPAVSLLVVGDGPLMHELKLRAAPLGDRIFFAGNQSNIDEWLTLMDIFVLPSFVENHSVSLLEAMRSGKPIIATSVGGNQESIRDHVEGLIVPPGDTVVLKSAIMELIRDPLLAGQYGLNARERFLRSFTEEQMHQNLSDYFNSLVKQN
jgi:glycosyltransferase involved in cell wall biosynthesis